MNRTGYTYIPGTRVYMKIPESFTVSPYGIGVITNDRYDQIIVQDNITGNYYVNAKDYTLATLDGMTPEPVYFEELKIEGYDAKLSVIESSIYGGGNMTLVFGDSTFCVMISVIYDHKSSLQKEAFKEALLSVRYDRDKTLNPQDFVRFEVQNNSSGFVFSEYSMGIFTYKKEGVAEEDTLHRIIVTYMPAAPEMSEYELLNEIISQVRNQADGFWYSAEEGYGRYSVNGYNAREIILRGKRKDEYISCYLTVLADTENKQAVSFMYLFADDDSRPINPDKIADVKEFVQAIRLLLSE